VLRHVGLDLDAAPPAVGEHDPVLCSVRVSPAATGTSSANAGEGFTAGNGSRRTNHRSGTDAELRPAKNSSVAPPSTSSWKPL